MKTRFDRTTVMALSCAIATCGVLAACGEDSRTEIASPASPSASSDPASQPAVTASPDASVSQPTASVSTADKESDENAEEQPNAAQPGADAGPLGELYADVTRVATSKKQRAVLSDNKVTAAELKKLYADQEACVAQSGIKDYAMVEGEQSYSAPEGMTDAEVAKVIDACSLQHVGAVELITAVQPVDQGVAAGDISPDLAAAISACYVTFNTADRLVSKDWRAASLEDPESAVTPEMKKEIACLDAAHAKFPDG